MKVDGTKSQMRRKVKGQTLVIVGLLVGTGVLLGLVALAFDGGSALLQRRAMQNGADAASLGTAKMLAASVVISTGVPIFSATNQDATNTTTQLMTENRGGTVGTAGYRGTLYYGHFDQVTSTYTFTQAATYDGASWTYDAQFPSTTLVPSWVDAVRVNAGIDNPTTFARALGITTIPVSAVAAAALQGANYTPSGPTWPMTRCSFPNDLPPVTTGICQPFLFWASSLSLPTDGCDTSGNWKDLIQLGADQGDSYQDYNDTNRPQLIYQFDTRPPMLDASGVNNPCTGFSGLIWSPAGNCTNPTSYPPYGQQCCATTNKIKYDVLNWLGNDFQGRLSITVTRPASAFAPLRYPVTDPNHYVGDWPEAYNGGVTGNNVQSAIYNFIHNSPNAGTDSYSGPPTNFGKYIDKTMYLYKVADGERWDNNINDPATCSPDPAPCKGWVPESSTPNRIHLTQVFIFRFYENLSNPSASPPATYPLNVCGTNARVPVNSSEVKGVFVGEEISQPPPDPGGHGTYNFVGPIDP